MKNSTLSVSNMLLFSFLIFFIHVNLAQTQQISDAINHEVENSIQASADEIDFSDNSITNKNLLSKEEIRHFLSERITFERPLVDIGIKDVYGTDYPITIFYINRWRKFLDGMAEGIKSGKISNEKALKTLYVKFITTTKHKIESKQYNVNLKNPTKKPNSPTPEKQLNGPCVNMDFEEGTTNGWTLIPGSVDGSQQYSFVPGPAGSASPANFVIETVGNDPVTGIPMVNPNGGGSYSLRLGDGTGTNYGAARISQSFLVTASNYIFTYSYALILQSPSGHSAAETPYFSVRVYDEAGNNVTCGAYSVVATAGNEAGFTVITSGSDEIWYKDWTTVFTPLQAYIGQNVTIEFTTGDCGQGAHYGYAYVDASCSSSGNIMSSATAICDGDPATLTAPAGAESYAWNTGDTTQSVVVTAGGNYTVDITPFSGSMCAVSLDIDIVSANNPIAAFSGLPTTICQGQDVVFTDASSIPAPDSVENWQWNFGDGITTPMSNGNITSVSSTSGTYTNPTHTFNNDGNYNVELIVENSSGCDDTITHLISVTPGPSTIAGSDQTLCEGDTVTLTGSGTATSYTWDNGVVDGTPFVQDTGTVQYILTGVDGACTSKDTVNVSVVANPTPSITGDTTYCTGTSITLDAGAGYNSYLWSDGSTGQTGTFTAADNPISVTVSMNPGCDGTSQVVNAIEVPQATHDSTITICQGESVTIFGTPRSTAGTFSQTYPSASGCDSLSNVTLVVNPLPTIDAGTSQTICEGDSVLFNASGGTSYSWDNGVQNGQTYSVNTTTTYTVTGTDANNCTNTDAITITINPAPTVNAGADQTICFGDSVVLSATSTGVGNYSWDNGVQNGDYFNPSTTLTYTVTDSSTIGCVSSDQVVVTVNPLPNVNANDTVVCEGNAIALCGSGAQTYTWNLGVQNCVSFVPTLGTTVYYVSGTDANGCVNSDSAIVTVYSYPNADVSANPIVGYKPLVVDFYNHSNGGDNYYWDFGDGTSESAVDTTSTSHLYPIEGEYIVVLEANNNGCLDTTSIIITVNPYGPPGYNIPNVFTPNGDGQNDIFHLSLVDVESVEIQIFNRWGNHMKTITDVKNSGGWGGKTKNGNDASEGTYFFLYHIVGKNGDSVDGQGFVQLIRK